jgi:hypothetical protein
VLLLGDCAGVLAYVPVPMHPGVPSQSLLSVVRALDLGSRCVRVRWARPDHELGAAVLAQLTPQQGQAQVLARCALWLYATRGRGQGRGYGASEHGRGAQRDRRTLRHRAPSCTAQPRMRRSTPEKSKTMMPWKEGLTRDVRPLSEWFTPPEPE